MKANILVIDDEESIRFTFERFLTLAGHKVLTARDSAEALDRIDQGGIDIVFADIILPDGNGIDLLKKMRLKAPECPVIVITAYPSVETVQASLRMGAFDYITKPVLQQDLMRVADMALQAISRGQGKQSPPQ